MDWPPNENDRHLDAVWSRGMTRNDERDPSRGSPVELPRNENRRHSVAYLPRGMTRNGERDPSLGRRWIDHQMKMTVIWRHIGLVDWRGMTKKSNPNLRLEWRWNDQTTSEWHQMMSNDGPRCVRHSWQSAVVSSFHFFSVFSWITRKDRNCTRKTDWCGKKWTEVPYSKKKLLFFSLFLCQTSHSSEFAMFSSQILCIQPQCLKCLLSWHGNKLQNKPPSSPIRV